MDKRRIDRDDLYRLRIVGDAQPAPDGQKVAYVVKQMDKEKNTYGTNIFVWSDGSTRRYTSGEKDASPRWSPDGRWLAFLSDRDDKKQIYVMSTMGGEATALTTQKLGAGTPVWSPDSRSIAFAGPVPFGDDKDDADEKATDEKKPQTEKTKIIDRAIFKADGTGFVYDRRTHIFVIPVDEDAIGDKTARQLTDGDCNDEAPAWSPDGRRIAFSGARDDDWDVRLGSDIWLVDAAGGEPRRLTKHDGLWENPVFSPSSDAIAYAGQQVAEGDWPGTFPQLWSMNLESGEATNLIDGQDIDVRHSVGSDSSANGDFKLYWLSDGLYFLTSVHGQSHVYRLHDGALDVVVGGRRDVMDLVAVAGHAGAAVLAFAVSDTTHPAEAVLYREGGETRISFENDALLDEWDLGVPKRTTFTGADGDEVEGWVIAPAGRVDGQRYPLLVYIHGGPATAYGESFFHELQWWAARGYGVAYCNPHGSSSYGQHFQDVIRRDWGNRDYHDVMAFTDHVAALPWVDRGRLVAAGGSYGGFMVNWMAGRTDRFAALCTQRSICNQVSQSGTSDYAPLRRHSEDGTPEQNSELLWDQSPLKYVRNVHMPMLILHQEQDHRCPIEEGEQWFSALKRLGVTTRFIRFPEESHGMSRSGTPSRRYERLGYMEDWFTRYAGPRDAGSPHDSAVSSVVPVESGAEPTDPAVISGEANPS